MIYKYTSCKRVIAKVISDLDIQEENLRIADMIEWIGEALLKIGGFPYFINKTTGKEGIPLTEIENYQAELPSDFHSLLQVLYSPTTDGPFYPMRTATGSLDHTPEETEAVDTGVQDVVTTSSIIALVMDLYTLDYADAIALLNTNPEIGTKLNTLLGESKVGTNTITYTTDYVYTIRGGYIKTNQSTGYLSIAYQAIPIDDEGYPLIPDDVGYVEALYWYIVMKLYYPKWVMGSIRDAIYYEARRSWNYYCKQAYGNAMMPDRDTYESIKNAWVRLVPEINAHNSAYSFIGEQEQVYNHANVERTIL